MIHQSNPNIDVDYRKLAVSGSFEKVIPIRLTVIIPVHNEEEIINEQTINLVASVRQVTDEFELLFVENGSTDNTLNEIKSLESKYDVVRFISLRKADYSSAVIEGIRAAKGDRAIVAGIDYVDLSIIRRCLRALECADVVICSKNKGVDKRPLMNRLANRSYNILARLFFREGFSDIEGYHGYRTKKIQPLVADIKTRAHLCNLWILLKARRAGLVISEIPLVVYERRKSKFMNYSRLPYLAAISILELLKLRCKGY